MDYKSNGKNFIKSHELRSFYNNLVISHAIRLFNIEKLPGNDLSIITEADFIR